MGKIKPEQKLAMMYLANDLVQNSRKKYPEVSKEFGTVMKATFTHLAALQFDGKTQQSLNRLINIWTERQSFDKKVLSDINEEWGKRSNKCDSVEPSPKKKKIENNGVNDKIVNIDIGQTSDNISNLLEVLKSTSDLDTSEQLLSSLPDLSNFSETELSPDQTKERIIQLSEAEGQLQEQTKSLEEEIETRTYLEQLMSNYILAQRKLIAKKKERLKNCKNKLDAVEEAKSFYESQFLDADLVDAELDSIPMPE